MNAIPFDTLKMARKLEAAGFPGAQAAGAAEAMAEAMAGAELATKGDLLAVKGDLLHEIGLVRSDVEREIGRVRTDMTSLETRLTAAITKVSSDSEILRRDITIRLGAVAVASTGVIITALRLMLAHP
jgi:hypothetical protein